MQCEDKCEKWYRKMGANVEWTKTTEGEGEGRKIDNKSRRDRKISGISIRHRKIWSNRDVETEEEKEKCRKN